MRIENKQTTAIIPANRTKLKMSKTPLGKEINPEISITLLIPNTANNANKIPTRPSPAIIPEQKRTPLLTEFFLFSSSLISLSNARRTRPPTMIQALSCTGR